MLIILIHWLFRYASYFDMLLICYVVYLLFSYFDMLIYCYDDLLLCQLFDMAFICYARYLLCLLFIFFVTLRNTLICTSKFICYPTSWRVLWYVGSIYGMIVSHTVSILYSSVQFVLYERNLQMHKLSKHKLMGNFDGVLLQIYTENAQQIEHTHI